MAKNPRLGAQARPGARRGDVRGGAARPAGARIRAKEIKQAVVGQGGADKAQVQHMVRRACSTCTGKLQADAADALAVAITHAHVRATASARWASAIDAGLGDAK